MLFRSNYIGEMVEKGEVPADMEFLAELVRNISYQNAKTWVCNFSESRFSGCCHCTDIITNQHHHSFSPVIYFGSVKFHYLFYCLNLDFTGVCKKRAMTSLFEV